MNVNQFFLSYIKEDFYSQFIPMIFEKVVKQYLIKRNKEGIIKPSFSKIGTYWYDDIKNKKNGQFDVVTYDTMGYVFYEVKYTNSKINDNVVAKEILKISFLGLNYRKLGFVSKNGFDVTEKDKYILISLDEIYI